MSDDRRIQTPAGADRPTLKLFSAGNEVSPEYQVLAVTIDRAVNKVASATLLIYDGDPSREDFKISNTPDFLPGTEIEVHGGYHSQDEVIFKGLVVSHGLRTFENKPSVLRIVCKDAAVKLTVARKNRYFYQSTDAEIIEQLARDAGLQVQTESTKPSHREMVQYNTTDWDFLISRAELNGKLVYTDDGKLVAAAPDLSQSPVISLRYGGNLLDFESETDARWQYKAVNAMGWDAANQEVLSMQGKVPSGQLPGNLTPDALADVIGLEADDLRHAGQLAGEELQAWADALMLKSRLSKSRVRARIQGLGNLRPGQVVELNGAGDRFNGKYFLAGIRHEINPNNWETNLELGLSPQWFSHEHTDITHPKASGVLPALNGLQIGLVTALEGDPDNAGRIQVRIPIIDPQEEGVWARVASLDAGDNRGAYFMPEINDEVVLGFLNDDPRNPVVLGMLNSGAKPAPLPNKDDNHQKGFVSRSGIKIIFDDDKINLIIETPKGNTLKISEENEGITLEDQNGNSLVLDANGITVESAGDLTLKASGDIKAEGKNITISAQTNFKAEGSSGAEVSSSATAVLKGSMVQIN
ncbi:MAG: type VI secretion system tip protein VgrG [Saprospiraceae bacterium]|nr:type VI secretion system tip protein VgrG [Saprospiraceae bacterium]